MIGRFATDSQTPPGGVKYAFGASSTCGGQNVHPKPPAVGKMGVMSHIAGGIDAVKFSDIYPGVFVAPGGRCCRGVLSPGVLSFNPPWDRA